MGLKVSSFVSSLSVVYPTRPLGYAALPDCLEYLVYGIMLTTPSFIIPLRSLWHGGLLGVVRGHPGTGEDSGTEEKVTDQEGSITKKQCPPKVALLTAGEREILTRLYRELLM